MATRLASYDYTLNSDTDATDSDYGFDLTVEEEELLEALVAGASSKTSASDPLKRQPSAVPAPATSASTAVRKQPARSGGAGAAAGASSLRADIAAAFATRASVKSLNNSELNFNLQEALRDPGFTYRDDPLALSHLAATATGSKKPPAMEGDDLDDDDITALVEDAERRRRPASRPAKADDIRYPDLSYALSGVPDSKLADPTPESNHEAAESSTEAVENKLSPLVRFRSFPKKPFSVSDLIAGAWCELQYYYTLTKLPGGKKTRTAAMKGGTNIHKKLEEEVYTTVTIEIAKKEDAFGLRLWNIIQGLRTLRDKGMTRELEVWGLVDGHVVNGVIDNLSYENPDPQFEEEVRSSQGSQEPSQGGSSGQQKVTTFFHSSSKPLNRQIFITDVKTRGSRHIPSGAAVRPTKIQLFLYHRFLSEMAVGRLDFMRVLRRYGLDADEPFSDTFVAQIGSLHDEIFEDAVDDSVAWTKKSGSTSDYRSASSSPDPASPTPDLIRYRTLRQLISLLETELRLTFPDGADSLGSLVTVEYRKRARRDANGVEDDDDEEAGKHLGANVFFVDQAVLEQYLAQNLEWWEGKRDPCGVPLNEAYKCRSCEFAEECEWRQEQDADILRQARKRIAGRRKKEGV